MAAPDFRPMRLMALAGDALIVFASPFLAYWLRFRLPLVRDMPRQLALEVYLVFAVVAAVTAVVVLRGRGCYRTDRLALSVDVVVAVLRATLICYLAGLAVAYFTRGFVHSVWLTDVPPRFRAGTPSRLVLLLGGGSACVLLLVWRALLGEVLVLLRRRSIGALRVALFGVGRAGQSFWEILRGGDQQDYEAVGYIAPTAAELDDGSGVPVLGTAAQIREILERHDIEQIVATSEALASDAAPLVVDACRRARVTVVILADGRDLVAIPAVHREAGVSILDIDDERLPTESLVKRLFDIASVLAGILLLAWLLVPVFLVTAVAVKLDSRGPVFFRQTRPGRRGRMFTMTKFRSMRTDAAQADAEKARLADPRYKLTDDPRVTRVGRFIRRWSIDELPQLWSVLAGDMSLVGPRPPTAQEVDHYADWQMRRLEARPGMVGLAQVSGRSDLTAEDIARLDLYYIRNWSLWLDVKILLKTIPTVLRGDVLLLMPSMKRIIYANSHHEEGRYLREAAISAASFRRHVADPLEIVLYTDDRSYADDAFDHIVHVDFEVPPAIASKTHKNGQMVVKHRAMIETTADWNLVLGSDTLAVSDRVDAAFALLERFDIAATHAPSRDNRPRDLPGVPDAWPEFNCDVIFYRKTPAVIAFLEEWARIYRTNELDHEHDQGGFRYLSYHGDLRVATLPFTYNDRVGLFGRQAGDGIGRRDSVIVQNRDVITEILEGRESLEAIVDRHARTVVGRTLPQRIVNKLKRAFGAQSSQRL